MRGQVKTRNFKTFFFPFFFLQKVSYSSFSSWRAVLLKSTSNVNLRSTLLDGTINTFVMRLWSCWLVSVMYGLGWAWLVTDKSLLYQCMVTSLDLKHQDVAQKQVFTTVSLTNRWNVSFLNTQLHVEVYKNRHLSVGNCSTRLHCWPKCATFQACCATCCGLIQTKMSRAGVKMIGASPSPLGLMWSASSSTATTWTSSVEHIR